MAVCRNNDWAIGALGLQRYLEERYALIGILRGSLGLDVLLFEVQDKVRCSHLSGGRGRMT